MNPEIHREERLVEGQRLHYAIRGDGPAVLLVHGLGATSHIWDRVLPGLEGMRAVAVDLPGCGRSLAGGLEDLRRVGELLDRLMLQLGERHYLVAGHSLGGVLALELALERPGRVQAAALINAAVGLPFIARLGAARGLGEAIFRLPSFAPSSRRATRLYLQRLFGEPARLTEATVEAYFHAASSPGYYRTMLSGLRGLARWGRTSEFHRLAVPTAVIWGTRDPLFPEPRGRRLAGLLPGAHFLPIDGCGHCPPEETPEIVARTIRGLQTLAERRSDGP